MRPPCLVCSLILLSTTHRVSGSVLGSEHSNAWPLASTCNGGYSCTSRSFDRRGTKGWEHRSGGDFQEKASLGGEARSGTEGWRGVLKVD